MLSSRRGESLGEVRKIKRYAAPGLGKGFICTMVDEPTPL